MARGRFASMEEMFQYLDANADGEVPLSSSWPSASGLPKTPRREPPMAPQRKPSDADWDVPPMHLGTKSVGTKPFLDDVSTRAASFDGRLSMDIEDDEEHMMFHLEGSDKEDGPEEAEDFGRPEFCLVEEEEPTGGYSGKVTFNLCADIQDMASSPAGSGNLCVRSRSCSMSPTMGASPVLLSALERVAAEAGSHIATRSRIGTI
eukprot:TRINITY_DN107627_c0_g1_i1.p1 TRINITY_DN107627_c0_g1~~TRINITY_DN107627_c0_g1_i1.p1  ORF type:complete len:205 (-),score=38.23 TRINITY_DN107627_c0_g1_i1:260-874(-)